MALSSEPQPRAARLELAAAVADSSDDEPMTKDEERWVGRVRQSLREQTPEALGAPAKVFSVPPSLRDTRPEAYAPHFFALGPYHHARPELMDMERFKLAGAKRMEMLFAGGRRIEDLMERFLEDELELKIRSTYHRTLNQSRTTLAWMMAIDACFLLDFIENYHRRGGDANTAGGVLSSSANWTNALVRDAMMLENQVPLFVLAKALELRHATRQEAAKALHALVDRFVKDVSPIKITGDTKPIGDLTKRAHLLEVLYHFLVPEAALLDENNFNDELEAETEPPPPAAAEDEEEVVISHEDADDDVSTMPSKQDQGFGTMKQVLTQMSSLNIAPVRFIKKNLISRPMALASTLSGKLSRKAPALAALVPVLGKLAQSMDVEAQLTGGAAAAGEGDDDLAGGAPRADEIRVPSVEQLARCGVRFVPTPDGIAGIHFDSTTATLRLPHITLDANTEVVLRNLVAYEAVAVRGPLVLARYTELMNGIVDTSKDVKILRRSGVVANRMKSGKEAAAMWNGMARAARLTRVPRIDAAIAAVNEHRGRSAAARVRKMMKRYVFRSWKMLTLLASVGLLVMTALQTFCSAYPCGSRWFLAGGVVPGADDPAQ